MVGLQECLVARGWGHGGFCTGESETHCRWLAWFIQGPGQWAGHLGWFVSDAVVGRWRGSMLPLDPVSILTQTEAVPLLLALAGSFMNVYASLHCWELMLSMIISSGCMSPTVPQSIAAMNRSLSVGLFSVWLWQLVVLSPFYDF